MSWIKSVTRWVRDSQTHNGLAARQTINKPSRRRPGESARDKRQREATAELAALFAPKKPS